MIRFALAFAIVSAASAASAAAAAAAPTTSVAAPAATAPATPPGVVICHLPAKPRKYVGSPGAAVLPDGTYLAKCDEFGPGTTMKTRGRSRVYRSTDRGATWKKLADVDGLFWASIFVHRGAVYLMGTDAEYGHAVIRKSTDGGRTWTQPTDRSNGLLLDDGPYHTAPVPVAEHAGRLWRAMEDAQAGEKWGLRFGAFVMSAPADADLLRADNWTCSTRLARDGKWLGGTFGGWLEGNAVVAPDGGIVDLLRVDSPDDNEKAAIIRISPDGKTATFDPTSGFVDFPGGAKKFTVRFDPQSKLYWSLANVVPPDQHGRARTPAMARNTLALIASSDLRHWTVRDELLQHPDATRHGFQYADWLFDGDDLIAVVRTAWDDAAGGAHNAHDANFLTFHRVTDFRTRGEH